MDTICIIIAYFIRRRCVGVIVAYLVPDSGIRYAADPWVAMVNRTMLRKVFPFLFPVRGKVVNFSDPWEECIPCGGEGKFL